MLRPADLVTFLVTIRNAIAQDLRPDLKSDHARGEAGALLLILDRLIVELRSGNAVAAERLEAWNAIGQQLSELGFGAASSKGSKATEGFLGAIDELIDRTSELQSNLGTRDRFAAFGKQLASGDPQMRRWLEQTVAALLDLGDASEPEPAAARAEPTRAAAEAPDESAELRRRLDAYLHARFPGLPAEPITQFRIAPGGHAKQTAILSIVPNEHLPERLVLRRDLALSITGTKVTDEFPIMERVFKLNLPVPRPILVESDASVLGGRFMLMTEVTDAAICGTYFPEERRGQPRLAGPDFGREVAQLLARLHSTTRTQGVADEQRGIVLQSYEAWDKLSPKPPASLAVDLGFAWMLNYPLGERPRCLIHGDVGTHNMLVRDGHLAAMLDWELAKEGDPAEDLAQCRMLLLPDTMPWEEFAHEYVAAGGDPWACESSAVAWFCIYTFVKHGLMNGVLCANYFAGRRDDVIAASVSGHYVQRLMQYQAKALQIALAATATR
jgi:aminoglycoside phosphotransferase (APT) family kinase protein